jgi:hypothetical protein
MKRHLLLMSVILATTAAIADAQTTAPSSRADAQAQAASLLSRPHTSEGVKTDEVPSPSPSPSLVSTTADAQAQAAMLLNGVRPGSQVRAFLRVVEPTDVRPSADAQAQAAALLSGSRASAHSQVQAERTQGGARAVAAARARP